MYVIVGRMHQQKVIMCACGKLQTVDRFTIAPRGNETVAKRRKRSVTPIDFASAFQIENAVICYSIIPMPVTPPWAVATMLKFRKRTVGGYSCGPRGVLHNMRAVLCANRGVNIK